jgi:hypothetical protein
MNHRVTIGTNGYEIFDGVYHVFIIHRTYCLSVVDMNEFFAKGAVYSFEIESTGSTVQSVPQMAARR